MKRIFTILSIIVFYLCTSTQLRADEPSPKCNGSHKIAWSDSQHIIPISALLTNDSILQWIDIQVLNGEGKLISNLQNVGMSTTLSVSFCEVFESNYTIWIKNQSGECSCQIEADLSTLQAELKMMDTVVYSIDPIAYMPVDEDYPFAPSLVSPCKTSRTSAEGMTYVGDSIIEGDCHDVFERVIYRMWKMDDREELMTDIIRVAPLPKDLGQYTLMPEYEALKSFVVEEPVHFNSEFLSCQWGEEFQFEEANCKNARNTFSMLVPIDKWPEDIQLQAVKFELPQIDKNGIKTGHSMDYYMMPDAIMPSCHGDMILEVIKHFDEDNHRYMLTYELKNQDEADDLLVENVEVPLIDDIGPRLVFQQNEFTFETKNGNQDYLDIEIPSPLMAIDHCSGIKAIKVYDGQTAQRMTYNEKRKIWEVPNKIRIKTGESKHLTYFSYDHYENKSKHYVKLHVKNGTPYTISKSTKNITVSGNKEWVNVSKFAGTVHGGYGKKHVYGRRLDWEEYCMDLCSEAVKNIHSHEDFNKLNPLSVLADHKGDYELEHHYKKQIEWWAKDGDHCEKKLALAWKHAIKEYWAEHCIPKDEHGYPNVWIEHKDPLGGGWCKEIPFSCEDACKEVMVEILYMDHYCNWHKDWVTVNVNSGHSSNHKVQSLGTVKISCEAFANYYGDILEKAIDAGNSSNGIAGEEAFAALDNALGSYVAAYHTNSYGWPMDKHGHNLAKEFTYKDMKCHRVYKVNKTWEYDHYGRKIWVYDTVWHTSYAHITKKTPQGYIKASCATDIEQDIWDLRNSCGLGKIKRRFKVHSSCGSGYYHSSHKTYEAVIEVVPGCNTLDHSMIDIPPDTVVCQELTYALDGTIDFGEGFPMAKLEIPDGCNKIGYSVKDEVYRLLGYESVHKVLRNYTFNNWCTGDEVAFTQKIVIDKTCTEYKKQGSSSQTIDHQNISRSADNQITAIQSRQIEALSIYPNPAIDATILYFSSAIESEVRLHVWNSLGQLAYTKSVDVTSGENRIKLSTESLVNGLYSVEILRDGQRIGSQKLVVSK